MLNVAFHVSAPLSALFMAVFIVMISHLDLVKLTWSLPWGFEEMR